MLAIAERVMLKLCRVLLLAAVGCAATASAADKYEVVLSGTTRGELKVSARGGVQESHYAFADRGRGPALISSVTYDSRGWPKKLTVTGTSLLRTPVKETFDCEGGNARWSSAVDSGTAKCSGFYLPQEADPSVMAALAKALLTAPDGSLALLPAGHARIEAVSRHRIEGAKNELTLYFITGLDFGPLPIWLDDKGGLAFQGQVWIGAVKPALRSSIDAMLKIQEDAVLARHMAAAQKLRKVPTGPVLFRNVRMYDATTKRMLPSMSVLVRDSVIERVGPATEVTAPSDTQVIDGAGKTLLPGLFDMHTHTALATDGPLAIASGVTSIRDLANDIDTLMARKKLYDEGKLVGPRIVPAGMVDSRGQFAGPTKLFVDTPEEANAAIERIAGAGYRQVKIYSSFKPELIPSLIAAARSRGLRVSGHVPTGVTMERAIELGFDEIQHSSYWLSNFAGPTAPPKNGIGLPPVPPGLLDPGSPDLERLIALMQSHRTVLDPTLAIYQDFLLSDATKVTPSLQGVGDRLPLVFARTMRFPSALQPERMAQAKVSMEALKALFKRFHEAGIEMVVGTDFVIGLTLAHEMQTRVDAGVSSLDVLYMATLGAARVAGTSHQVGSIEAGKLADLVLVRGDPERDIGVLRATDVVMKDGVLFQPDEVFSYVGVGPTPK